MAGFQSFFIGLLLLVVMAYCATIAETHYPNLVSFISSAELNRKPKFFEILIELLIQCTILAFFFYFFARFVQKYKVRFIDFLGTVYFSRFPYFVLTIYIMIIRMFYPQILSRPQDISLLADIMFIILYLGIAWQFITYFFAFKESSGLKDTKLWIGFILCLVLASFTSGIMIQALFGFHQVKL